MTTNIFRYYLKKTFYHPERNNMFPSYRMKAFSRYAILQLWNIEHFKVGDKTYNNTEIRYILLERMLPEHLDCAIKIFVSLNRDIVVKILMYLIIVCVINQNGLMELLAEYDVDASNHTSKGGVA